MASQPIQRPSIGHEGLPESAQLDQQIAGGGAELHVVSDPLLVGGREFRQCSCGLVWETFGLIPCVCPVGDAEADYAAEVATARAYRDRVIALWRELSIVEQRHLAKAARHRG